MAEAPPPAVSTKRKRGKPNQTTGLIGVAKNGKKYKALINYGGTAKYLGVFDTKEQAGIAYDRAAIDQSTEEVSFTLNYPNMTDPEREEALKVVEPPHKKRKRGTKRSGVESDGGGGSNSSASCHKSDDDESDDEEAVEASPFPQVPPYM